MKEVRSEIRIDASPEEVWRVLTDFAAYPTWNPFVKSISGDMKPGERITLTLQPGPGEARTVRPKVLCVDPGKSFVWQSHHSIPFLVRAAHCFEIEPDEGGKTRFIQREIFSGLLASIMARRAEAHQCGFEEMNRAIKVAAEWLARPGKSKKPDPSARKSPCG